MTKKQRPYRTVEGRIRRLLVAGRRERVDDAGASVVVGTGIFFEKGGRALSKPPHHHLRTSIRGATCSIFNWNVIMLISWIHR